MSNAPATDAGLGYVPYIQPPATLVMGPTGSGKTYSLVTLAKAGLNVFVFITEPTGADSLLDAWDKEKLPLDGGKDMGNGIKSGALHYTTITPAAAGWAALKDMGVKINNMSYSDLANIKSGVGKEHMKQFPRLIQQFETFQCQRDGKFYGDVTELGPDSAVCMDSLSGLSLITMQHTVGFKPSPHQGEWGIAMSTTEAILLKLSADCKCFFVLTSHIEKEPDEITGMARVTVSTLGRKLAPKIPRFFSEVVRARKDGNGTFRWATQDSEADLKNRCLPNSPNLAPDFGPIVEAYRRRMASITPQAQPAAPSGAPQAASQQK